MLPAALAAANASIDFTTLTGNFKQVNATKLSNQNTADGMYECNHSYMHA
tara:strand:+ start:97 stop:246 length:150 start_codon:yes stop_codon:yes gene_type:complete